MPWFPEALQCTFSDNFEKQFTRPVSYYNLIDWSAYTTMASRYWVAFDKNDLVSPYSFTTAFLDSNSSIDSTNYLGAGHERIIKSSVMIQGILRIFG